jgi:uncharacterized SAM-binding protein YcdF (DUF218 family)
MELTLDAMAQMGVPKTAVTVLPHEVDNTAQEANAVRELVTREGWTSLIVVTSIYHTRRADLAFRREFRGTPVKIIIRSSRYDRSQPRRYWARRGDIRFVSSELQKLILYRLGLRE